MNVEDVHFILGPSTNNISKPNDFDNADSPYETNQTTEGQEEPEILSEDEEVLDFINMKE